MLLAKTPRERMCDGKGRPYFLWDVDLTLDEFSSCLLDPDPRVRGYFVAKLMRQAKPDDVFHFVTLAQIAALWSELERYLGRKREFWSWTLAKWRQLHA